MRGFTLLELLLATAILSLIVTVGVPSISHIMDRSESNNNVSQFRRILTSARTIALSKSQATTACPIINQKCSNDWRQPIAVFVDENNNEEIDDGETWLLTGSNESKKGIWLPRNPDTKKVVFNERGHAFGSAMTFLYCPISGNYQYARQLIINFQGRIRSDQYLSNRGTPYASLRGFNCP